MDSPTKTVDEKYKTLKKTISKLIREIESKDGELDLENKIFLSLRDRVKKDGEDSKNTATILLEYLKYNSSHTRRCGLILLDYFYMKSPRFRDHIDNYLYEIIVDCCELEPIKKPLPPPKEDAVKLKIECIKSFQKWDEKFGEDNIRMQLAVKTLRSAKTIDYDRVSGETAVERRAKEEKARKEEEYGRMRMAQVSDEFDILSSSMERNVREAKELLLLLVPSFVEDDLPSTSHKPVDAQSHGYGIGDSFTVRIDNPVPEIVTSDTNIDVVRSAIDVLKQLNAHMKKVDAWVKIASKFCKDSSLNRYIGLRNAVKAERDKLAELNLRMPVEVPSDGEEEDEFEDVEEEIDNEEVDQDDEPGTSSGIKRDDSIKKVAFGLDLKYWGEKKEVAQIPMNNADCHRFWRPPDESEGRSAKVETYEQRVFTFIGEEQRGKRECGARLKKGGRCKRMDVRRCPLHGVIIDRDEEGFPMEEQKKVEREKREEDDEDEYMEDLEAQLGRSLRGKEKKRGKKKEGVDRSGKAVRERLEAKLLNPRTIKRVSAVLDEMRMAKIQKKFGDQHAHRYL